MCTRSGGQRIGEEAHAMTYADDNHFITPLCFKEHLFYYMALYKQC